ncbi:MAG: hypothetical protein P1V34_03755 [Alphaproteobacteria bacterium]|nr:hypothetical protein [Alphaproteobacteria bacterium]
MEHTVHGEEQSLMATRILTSEEPLSNGFHEIPVRDAVRVGQMVSLHLEEIEDSIEPVRLEKIKHLVGVFADKAFRSYLGPRDSFLVRGDGSYVVSFHEVSNDVALLKAGKIVRLVNEQLLGRVGYEGATMKTVVSDGKGWPSIDALTKPKLAAH